MMVRLVLGVVLVANILVLVVCSAETTQATATSESSASTTSTSSYASSSSSSEAVATSKPVKCRRGKKCPKHEEFSTCAQSLQRAQYCTEKAEPFSTSETTPDKSSCKEACVCKENYLRAANGTCIPAEQCPLTCGAIEVLDNCPSDCDSDYCPTEEVSEAATCATPDVCPPPMCKCAFNHRRASNGSCIPTRNCPPFACKTNEEFNACPPLCPTDDCSQASPSGQCPPQFGHIGIILPCNPKCRCIKDYWRLDGICVPYGQCPGVCPAHERYSGCLQGECKALNCTQKDQSIPCARIDPKYCEKGCVCEEGYLRNQDGVCVSEDKCEPLQPSCISDNEEYVSCMQGVCRAKNCSQKGQDVPCPDVPTEECDSGCICKENFLRASNGTCVPEDKCERPLTCGANEVLDNCPSDCDSDYCPTEEVSAAATCATPDVCPPPMCKCAFNHRRASNGSCIPTRNCPAFACKTNEEFNACPPLCPTDDCSQASPSGQCPPQFGHIGIILPCNPKCRCIKDYWRLDGICVPYGQCPGVCPANERYSGCLQGECKALNCTQKDQSIPCARIDPKYCEKGCVCEEGYLRNSDGVCVSEDKCEPLQPTCNSENEEYVSCMQGVCRAKNCSQKGQDVPCPDVPTEECDSGCICKENFLRASNGTCVPEDKCERPLTCSANEVLDNCPSDCDSDYCPTEEVSEAATCATPDVCPPPMCKCAFNHRRASNVSCIPTRNCPAFACKTNEEFNACPPLCPTDDCSQASPSGQCPPQFGHIGIILPCNPKCRCIKDYWRLDGICVPYGQCPGVCPAHERYSGCLQGECKALNCTQKDQSIPCARIDPKYCEKGCVCEEGYLRNSDGVCVSEDKCEPLQPSCISDNEEYVSCMQGVCRAKNCSQKGQDVPCPDVPTEECDSGCICKENFLRASNGTCVPEDKCERPLTCSANEVLDNCPSDCDSDYCPTEEVSAAATCATPDVCPPPICKCAFNHRRASNGSCIPTRNCPPFACKTNEEFNACPPLCPTDDCSQASPSGQCPPQFGHIGIILPCNPKCRCIKDYWRLDGICVPYGQCPGVCPAHERYSGCLQGECKALNCTQKDQSIPCARIDPKYCEKGCVCEEGYLRNQDGVCVSEDKCEPLQPSCISDNEEYVSCMQGVCRAKNCSQKGQDVPCPDVPTEECDSGCICKENFLRASNGTCVPEDKCERPLTCSANEVLDNCPSDCDSDYCPTEEVSAAATCATPDVCPPPICKCAFNHRRASNGSCIPTRDCPPFACKTNEEFNACPPLCPTDDCSQASPSGQCPPQFGHIGIILPCNPKCRCIKDYWRLDGICVPYGQCPGVCPANERYSGCLQGECKALNCTQKDQSIACARIDPKYCKKGCVCEEGYLRNQDGVCVSEDKCEPTSCPINEELANCTQAVCRAQDCYDKYLSIPCPSIPKGSCEKGCVCKWGYLRDLNNVCIPSDECPSNPCDYNKRPTNCTQAKCVQKCFDERMLQGCPLVAEGDCKEGCVCQEGYLEAEDGYCVPEDQCESTKCPSFEQWSFCSNAVCRAEHCHQKGLPLPCPSVSQCDPGCLCQGNYLRDKSGVCIPEVECNARNCSANEEWTACAQATCRTQNCTEKGKPVVCPMITYDFCEEGCVCKENYLRNENGECVPQDKCEPQLTCGENEVLDDCPPTCNTDNCPQSADDEEKWCVQADPCIPACKCRFNYKRAANGTCIPTTDCPAFDCSAKPNEEYVSCPPFCPSDECGKPRLEGRCPFKIGVVLQCKPKCQCKDGYGRVNDTCVPFAECPGLCPANEVYSPCMQQTCRPQNCSNQVVAMENCPTIDEASCQRGCVCQKNFYRNEGGVCVSYKKCGARNCSANEEWSTCAQATCRAQNCTEKGKPVFCPMITDGSCEEACVCKENYLRNENGECVPVDQCEPQLTCGKNEVLDDCPPNCNTDNCPQSADDEDVWCVQADPCIPACKCRFNYKRAANGTCIPTTDCPAFDCSAKPNEEYVSCPPFCPSDECGKPRLEGRCPFKIGVVLQCKPKCQCKDGYGRVNDTCVPFAECPGLCPAHEVYSPCMQLTCRPQNCSNRDAAMEKCPTIDEASCQRGCVCQENFYRNEEGLCVSYKKCGGEETAT